jgi:hypothetical protein
MRGLFGFARAAGGGSAPALLRTIEMAKSPKTAKTPAKAPAKVPAKTPAKSPAKTPAKAPAKAPATKKA